MTRESATRLAVESSGSDTSVVVRFEAGELSGELVVTVFPEVRVQDRMLFA